MDRPYRKGFSREELTRTLTEMKGTHLAPDLVQTLFAILKS